MYASNNDEVGIAIKGYEAQTQAQTAKLTENFKKPTTNLSI